MNDASKTLLDWELEYKNEKDYHKALVQTFTALANTRPELKAHRDFVEKNGYGFGDRSFHWMWRLIVDQMPSDFNFIEVGVFKGQVVSLLRLLTMMASKTSMITGVTPLSSTTGVTGKFPKGPEADYMKCIKDLHAHFNLPFSEDQIIVGDSTSKEAQSQAAARGPFDVVYIDGCHEYDFVVKDLLFYGGIVKRGGYLVVDDSSNFLNMYWGSFPGIEDVSRAVRDTIEGKPEWKHVMAVMHNRIFRRVL